MAGTASTQGGRALHTPQIERTFFMHACCLTRWVCFLSLPSFLLEPDHLCGQQTDSERTDTAADGETTATEVCMAEPGDSASQAVLCWRDAVSSRSGDPPEFHSRLDGFSLPGPSVPKPWLASDSLEGPQTCVSHSGGLDRN